MRNIHAVAQSPISSAASQASELPRILERRRQTHCRDKLGDRAVEVVESRIVDNKIDFRLM
jgi:hypothetical protein